MSVEQIHHSTPRNKRHHQSGYFGDDSGIDSEYESVGSASKTSYFATPDCPSVRAIHARTEDGEPPRKRMLQSGSGVTCDGYGGQNRSIYDKRLQQTESRKINMMPLRSSSGNQLNMRASVTNNLQTAANKVKNNLQSQEKYRLDTVHRILDTSLPVNCSLNILTNITKSLKNAVTTRLSKLSNIW